ncbi:transcription factor GTE10-like isoform X3 [Andrographis paniculata]|uniref:transcription factor GTE10-like isoform X3 n=1 Tax=Andrographis paniculata TaxID=175694 RepID=UPI0021E92CCA|nr:transcription factor GTE10-like isoform X3 [Andrographis paniculata]
MAPTVPIDCTDLRESKKFSKMVLGDMMGKARKSSKGYSGILPGYPRAAEIVAESEGLFKSDHGDALLNASQDTYTPNVKYISLNADAHGGSVVPVETLSLSKLSPLERRDLEARLKIELGKVRKLQRKIASFSFDAVVRSSTDVHGCQNEPMKKQILPEKNGHRSKGGSVTARKSESTKPNPPKSTNFVMLMKQCETLLTRLMQHQHAWIFNEPVDIVKHNIPDYFNVIKHPMDLGTVKGKLLSNQYSNLMEFAADVRLTFKNATTYNPPGHDVHVMAEVMSKHFEMRWKPIEKKISTTTTEPRASKSSVVVEPERSYVSPAKKQRTSSSENKTKRDRDKQVMTDVEKQKLGAELEDLLVELPDGIINFLKESSSNGTLVSEDEIEIDIDSLSDNTLFTLRKLLDDFLLEKKRKQEMSQQSAIERQKESGVCSLSNKHCQGNEAADEYVDIGGNDPPPASSSSPINNNTVDAAQKNISASQTSSSDSGSSSSDTDSESSSASEIDGDKNSEPTTVNGTLDTRAEQKQKFRNGYAEQNSVPNPSSSELNHHQQGESDRAEGQVSPDNRAAILRRRFADIINKAKRNALEKGENPDLEKLKLEREEVERRRKEARLLAEAKAAEEARIKSEAEAAAEAKRKIEREREAARQALQQMEKTVDINENSQFMEDLEMLKSGTVEKIQGLEDDASPESCQMGLGSFKFQASSNPLEQLGLYMKNDEEEDELEPERLRDTTDDPEEGEID